MTHPRLRDVAERAAVSMTTASIVLRRLPGARVSPETRARVDRAAAELGYRPRERHRQVRLVALTMDPAGGRENVLFLAAAVEAASGRDGLLVLLPERDDEPGDGCPALDGQLPLDGHVRVDPRHSGERCSDLAGRAVSVHLRPGSVPSGRTGISVVPDDRQAAFALGAILAGAGHRQVAVVAGEGEDAVARCWQEGIASALGAPNSLLVRVGDAPTSGDLSEDRTEQRGREREITALVCMSAASAGKARTMAGAGRLRSARDVVVLVRGPQDDSGTAVGDVTWLPLPGAEMARVTMALVLDERTYGAGPPAEDHVVAVPFPLPTGLTIAPPAAGVQGASAGKPPVQQRSPDIIDSALGGAQ